MEAAHRPLLPARAQLVGHREIAGHRAWQSEATGGDRRRPQLWIGKRGRRMLDGGLVGDQVRQPHPSGTASHSSDTSSLRSSRSERSERTQRRKPRAVRSNSSTSSARTDA